MYALAERVRQWLLLPRFGRSDIMVVLIAALAVRLVNLLLMPTDPAMYTFPDSGDYLASVGRWSADGSILGWLSGAPATMPERMPGYTWVLWMLAGLGLDRPAEIALAQAAVDSLTCCVIALIGKELSPLVGRLSGILAALSPTLVIHSTLVLQDTMLLLPFAGAVLMTVRAARAPTLGNGLVAGVLLGLAFMIRAVVQFLVVLAPIVVAVILIEAFTSGRLRRHAATAGAFLVGLVVVLTPLAVRQVNLGTPYPTTQSGLHALFWTVTLIRMNETGRTFDQQSRITQEMAAAELALRRLLPGRDSPYRLDAAYREIALKELRATSPLLLARVWMQGAVVSLFSPGLLSDGRVRALERPSFYETPGYSLLDRAWRYFFADPKLFHLVVVFGFVGVAGVSVFLVWGAWWLFRARPLASMAAFALIGYFLALSGPTSGPKYRMPFEPVLLVLTAIGLARALRDPRLEDIVPVFGQSSRRAASA